MTASNVDLYIEQGATFRRTFAWHQTLVDANGTPILDANGQEQPGTPYDLTGCTARMQVRKTVRSAAVMVTASSENGRIQVGGTDGALHVTLTAADTDLIKSPAAVYDLEVAFPGGDVFRVLEGAITCKLNVTR